jgi:tetratricopeptide (TPR) repeat protein
VRHWLRWLLCGLLVLVVPVGAGAQNQTKPQDGAKRPEAARTKDGGKGPDRQGKAEAHYELGVMHHERVFESLDQAIAEYERAVKLKPDYAEAHFNLGLTYHTKAKLGTDDKALYRKAVGEYKLYLKYSPQGELAAKAKQNIKALEAKLRQ